jgi:hypothetical protein
VRVRVRRRRAERVRQPVDQLEPPVVAEHVLRREVRVRPSVTSRSVRNRPTGRVMSRRSRSCRRTQDPQIVAKSASLQPGSTSRVSSRRWSSSVSGVAKTDTKAASLCRSVGAERELQFAQVVLEYAAVRYVVAAVSNGRAIVRRLREVNAGDSGIVDEQEKRVPRKDGEQRLVLCIDVRVRLVDRGTVREASPSSSRSTTSSAESFSESRLCCRSARRFSWSAFSSVESSARRRWSSSWLFGSGAGSSGWAICGSVKGH